MSKPVLLTTAVLLLGAMSVPALAASPSSSSDPVVARVNGAPIYRSDVLRELQMLGPQAQQIPPQMLYPQLLQKMIATKIVSDKGYAEHLQNDKDVKAQLKDAEDQIVAEVYLRRTIQPQITEAKIKAKYDEMVAKFKPEEEVRARHILVPTEAEAEDIIKQLKDGADFAKLAEEKSKDTGSAKNGGDLGYFPHDAMVKPFADAAFALKPGEFTQTPVKTEFGYHVIKVEDKRKSAPPPLSEVKDQIANEIGMEMTNDLVKKLEAKAKVEKFDINGGPLKASK